MDEAEVQSRTAVDNYQWFREVCTTKLLQTPILLGGPGVVVQIEAQGIHFLKKTTCNYLNKEIHVHVNGQSLCCCIVRT